MGTYTTNYNLFLPSIGEQGWGELVNNNFSTIDTTMKGLDTRLTDCESTDVAYNTRLETLEAGEFESADIGNLTVNTVTGNINAEGGLVIPLSANGFTTVYTTSISAAPTVEYSNTTATSPTFNFSDVNTKNVKYSGNLNMVVSYKRYYGWNAKVTVYKNGEAFITFDTGANDNSTVTYGTFEVSVTDSIYATIYGARSTSVTCTFTAKF